MLIKLYTLSGVLYIIEEVLNVCTEPYLFHYNNSNGEFEGPQPQFATGGNPTHYEPCEGEPELFPCRIIDFMNNQGIRSRIIVANKAYICNNNGKTVEAVQVS